MLSFVRIQIKLIKANTTEIGSVWIEKDEKGNIMDTYVCEKVTILKVLETYLQLPHAWSEVQTQNARINRSVARNGCRLDEWKPYVSLERSHWHCQQTNFLRSLRGLGKNFIYIKKMFNLMISKSQGNRHCRSHVGCLLSEMI